MKCNNFNSCSAPICPNDPSSLEKAVWFPGEEICKHTSVFTSNLRQLRNNKFKDLYFTYSMLSKPMTDLSDPLLKGIDAEPGDREKAVLYWLIQNRGCLKSNEIEGI